MVKSRKFIDEVLDPHMGVPCDRCRKNLFLIDLKRAVVGFPDSGPGRLFCNDCWDIVLEEHEEDEDDDFAPSPAGYRLTGENVEGEMVKRPIWRGGEE